MSKDVKQFVRNCKTYKLTKTSTTGMPYSLQLLPTAIRPWEVLSVDFITRLPLVNGYNSIATFVDTFTNHAHFVPCSSTITARDLA
jgi:hypothetical protein